MTRAYVLLYVRVFMYIYGIVVLVVLAVCLLLVILVIVVVVVVVVAPLAGTVMSCAPGISSCLLRPW